MISAGISQASSATSYSISGDFGTSVFQYGKGQGGSSFVRYPIHTQCQPQLDCYPDGASGNVVKNISATNFFDTGNGTVLIPPGTVHFHPTPTEDAIIRFIAPATGNWQISGKYWRNDITSAGNGTQLSLFKLSSATSQLLSSYFVSPSSYGLKNDFATFRVALQTGDIVEFALNNRGDYGFDSTGVDANFRLGGSVPEPASWMMLLSGFGLVGTVVRRRAAMPIARPA